jgi:putative oxidoreductase
MTNGGELAVLYCFAFFLLIFTGGGTAALNTWTLNRSRSAV